MPKHKRSKNDLMTVAMRLPRSVVDALDAEARRFDSYAPSRSAVARAILAQALAVKCAAPVVADVAKEAA